MAVKAGSVVRGDVHLVRFDPTVGSEVRKTRPCVVISPDELNEHLRTVIVAPMTTGGMPIRGACRAGFRTVPGSSPSIRCVPSTVNVSSSGWVGCRRPPPPRSWRRCKNCSRNKVTQANKAKEGEAFFIATGDELPGNDARPDGSVDLRKIDHLRGLKENVTMGRLIPTGTASSGIAMVRTRRTSRRRRCRRRTSSIGKSNARRAKVAAGPVHFCCYPRTDIPHRKSSRRMRSESNRSILVANTQRPSRDAVICV